MFTSFTRKINNDELPSRFNYPFHYQPHPLCVEAAELLQQHIINQRDWQHNFGLGDDPNKIIGKMFGVLLVQNDDGEVGYLSAFSGKLAEQNHWPHFVPPVFDMLSQQSFFLQQQSSINQLNQQLEGLENCSEKAELQLQLLSEQTLANEKIETLRLTHIENRRKRKLVRQQLTENLDSIGKEAELQALAIESVADKNQMLVLKAKWQQQIDLIAQKLEVMNQQILTLKAARKSQSSALQQHLFSQYRFLNALGKYKDLSELFADTSYPTPPAGAGECAAPKLLQYAYLHQLTPLAFAEFWWGKSPKSEIRQHRQFYPACQGKCQPILSHMLQGLTVDENPLLNNSAKDKMLEIVYQDEHMLVVNKPAELLSVPGKHINDSVYTRVQQLFPDVDSPFIVHRLDMSTSGLMVLALSRRAHKQLQKQFIERTVQKRYLALLEGEVALLTGEINLPLRGDYYDRPRQLVCFDYGKPATTFWEVISTKQGKTLMALTPKTGRTHQLRVHCAHALGLNTPIVGDDLYGKVANRLHLHAESLTLQHPITREPMHFQVAAEFE